MPVVIVRVTPTNYDAWHKMHVSTLERFGRDLGLVHETLFRDHADPRTVVIVQTIVSVDQLQAFMATKTFQDIVSTAPIEGPPTVWFLNPTEVVDAAALWT